LLLEGVGFKPLVGQKMMTKTGINAYNDNTYLGIPGHCEFTVSILMFGENNVILKSINFETITILVLIEPGVGLHIPIWFETPHPVSGCK
jgi:hypothetical protein